MTNTMYKVILCSTLGAQGALAHGGHDHTIAESALLKKVTDCVQEHIFRFDAPINAIIATVAIQLAPCFIVFLIPGLRSGGSESLTLKLLTGFALGTLLGDVFLHLIPEMFGEVGHHDHFKMKVLGSGLFFGFIFFMFLDKFIRIISGGKGAHDHSHGHSHSHSHDVVPVIATKSTTTNNNNNNGKNKNKKKNKNKNKSGKITPPHQEQEKTDIVEFLQSAQEKKEESSHSSAYLNIVTGFAHNIADGIALASAFYASKSVGVITTLAVICHEIPHEIGDFAILLSNGFSFCQALKSQFITSIGAVTGTLIGCWLNDPEFFKCSMCDHRVLEKYVERAKLYLSTFCASKGSLFSKYYQHAITFVPPCVILKIKEISSMKIEFSDLMLPITTGGFIYIAATSIVPEILHTSPNGKCCRELFVFILQLVAIFTGFALMMTMAH